MRFYKLFRRDEIHHGLKYRKGLNRDPIPFNPDPRGCSPGGLYFFSEADLVNWNRWIVDIPYWIRRVRIPKNAQVFRELGKSKASELFLYPRERFQPNRLEKYINFDDEEVALEIVRENGMNLRYISNNQTTEICFQAVRANPFALIHVKDQTYSICKLAVSLNSDSLMVIRDKRIRFRLWYYKIIS